MPPYPTVEEVKQHPAFHTAIWLLEPHKRGNLPVASGRGGPFNIEWEVHGDGPIKLVFVCGLGIVKYSYQRQTKHFGHDHGDKYSMLIVDNRGAGGSDKPIMRYSTSEMARDIIEVLDHIGWTEPRQVNAVGLSLGGMIVQEMGYLIPERISTLNLLSTAAIAENTTTFTENLVNRITLLMPKSPDRELEYFAHRIFAPGFPESADSSSPPTASTPRVKMPPGGEYLKFNTNFERFAAQESYKKMNPHLYSRAAFICQAVAGAWHHKSPTQLEEMAEKIGRERLLVIHGTLDLMFSPPHGEKLIKYLQPGVGIMVEGMGHAPTVEKTDWLHDHLEKQFAVGERLSGRLG